ncbi:hypothetical protein DL93DRAFT_123831 [Clavulina sp. PMI_390]|nr:hypothetical protein DL93DRAFT_123831 [Clavulina sp. PMI_390]
MLLPIRNPIMPYTNTLPIEILGEIFHFVTACDRIDDKVAANRLIRTLFALSAVNSYWRAVSTRLPSLWTHIHISNPKPALAAALGVVNLHLERSSNLSLDVYFRLLKDQSSEYQNALWHSIRPHLPPCRTLFLGRLLVDLAELILPLGGPLHRLESCRLDSPYMEGRYASKERAISFARLAKIFPIPADTAALKELQIIGSDPFWTFKWNVLEDYLQGCSMLSTAVLSFQLGFDDERRSLPLTLPSLRTLASSKWDFEQYLFLPNLKHLISNAWWTAALHHTPARYPTLERLSLARANDFMFELLMPAKPMPSLKQFDLVRSEAVEEFLGFIVSDTNPTILPNIKTLRFYVCTPQPGRARETLEATVSVLQARPTLQIVWDLYPREWGDLSEVPEEYRARISEQPELFPREWLV